MGQSQAGSFGRIAALLQAPRNDGAESPAAALYRAAVVSADANCRRCALAHAASLPLFALCSDACLPSPRPSTLDLGREGRPEVAPLGLEVDDGGALDVVGAELDCRAVRGVVRRPAHRGRDGRVRRARVRKIESGSLAAAVLLVC